MIAHVQCGSYLPIVSLQVFDDVEEHVIVMDRSGKVIGAPIAPRLRMLREFLLENADYCPVLPQQRSTVGKKAIASGMSSDMRSSCNRDVVFCLLIGFACRR